MKVLQINAVYDFGSTGKNVAQLHSYLVKNGIDSYVFYGEKKLENTDEIIYIGNIFDHKVHALLSRITGKQAYFSNIATRKLCKRIDKIKPHIIHLHNLHSNYINFPILMKHIIKSKINVLITLHDCWFFTGKCCHYVGVECNKWQDCCDNCPQLKSNNESWFFDNSKRMFLDKKTYLSSVNLGVIGVSDWITNEAKKSFLKDAAFIKKIYNWVDLSSFKPVDSSDFRILYDISKKDKIILAVSQGWNEAKGLYDLIKVAEHFSNYKVILVGEIPKEKSLPENMILIPFVSNVEKLVEIYSAADVFVNTSRMETFGKVTAEAMACGTPIVVYNNTANKELVIPQVGECADNLNVEDLINKITTVLHNGKEFYKENCVKTAHALFNIHDRLQDYVEAYKQLLN